MSPFLSGLIHDDYGFFDLRFFNRLYGLSRDTVLEVEVSISKKIRSQSFLQPLMTENLEVVPGESVDLYFIVRDNDAQNGYKSSKSQIISFNMPTYNESKEQYEKNNQNIKNDLTAEMSVLKNLEKELAEFERSLIEKDSLDWRDKKRLEEILKKQSDLEQNINSLKKTAKNNFEKLNSISPPNEEILKKQQELEKLFNDIIPDEMKDLYRELNELKEKLDKNELQQKIKD